MSTIVTRAGKGTPLTNTEVDANFTNLNTDKAELDANVTFDSLGTTGDITIESTSPELYLKDTTEVHAGVTPNALGRVQASSSGLGFRSRAADDANGVPQFGSCTFSKFDGTDTKTQMVLDPNNDLRVWNDTGQVRLNWDADFGKVVENGVVTTNPSGALAIGQSNPPAAVLDVHGNALIKDGLQIGESEGGVSQSALDIRGTNAETGNFIASVAAGVMTVTSVNNATLSVGDVIYSANAIPAHTFIKSFGTGSGGTGTYNLSQSFDLGSVTLRNSAKGTLTASITNADSSLRAGQPIGTIEFNDKDSSNGGAKGFLVCAAQDTTPSSYLAFGTHTTGAGENAREVARIDEAGNFLLNTISVNSTLDHIELRADGQFRCSSVNAKTANFTAGAGSNEEAPVVINRTGSDGSMLNLQQGSTTQLRFHSSSGNKPIIVDNEGKGIKLVPSSIQPRTYNNGSYDDEMNLGTESSRFKNLFLSGGAFLGGTTDDNKLEDYEEGSWTCGIANSAGTQTSTTTRVGRYTKVGRVVHVSVNMNNIEASSFTAGSLRITGLPFAVNSLSGARGHGSCQVNNMVDSNVHYYYIQGLHGTQTAQIKYNKNNATAHSVDVARLNSNGTSTILFDLTYIV